MIGSFDRVVGALGNRLGLAGLTLTYIVLVHFTYVNFIAPRFSYLRYTYNDPSSFHIVLAWAVALLPMLWIPTFLTRPSIGAYWLLYVLVIIPACLMSTYTVTEPMWGITNVALPIVAAFGLLGLMYRFPLMRTLYLESPLAIFWFGILGLTLFSNIYLILNFGFDLSLPSLLLSDEVYTRRFDARLIVSETGGLLGYVLPWQREVINPFLIAAGLLMRNWALVAIGSFGQLVGFSFDASKSTTLSPLLIVGVFYIAQFATLKRKWNYGLLFMASLVVLVVVVIVADLWFYQGALISLLIRRFMMTSGLLSTLYTEFFSENPKALLGHSIFSGFVEYPYDRAPPYVIGQVYFSSETSSNANLWADGFANFGLWGMVGFTVLLACILWFYDSLSQRLDLRFSTVLMIIPAFALTQSAFLTTLVTHGLLIVIVLIAVLPSTFSRVSNTGTKNEKSRPPNISPQSQRHPHNS